MGVHLSKFFGFGNTQSHFNQYDVEIHASFLMELAGPKNKAGWPVRLSDAFKGGLTPNPPSVDLPPALRCVTVGVIGWFGKGKTHLINSLTGRNLPCGDDVQTHGLSFVLDSNISAEDSRSREAPVAYLDTAGMMAPIQYDGRPVPLADLSAECMLRDHFLQDTVLHVADHIIVVVEDITAHEQELIYSVCEQLGQKSESTNTPLFVVHNYRNDSFVEARRMFKAQTEVLFKGVDDHIEITAPADDPSIIVTQHVADFASSAKQRHIFLCNANLGMKDVREAGQAHNESMFALLKDSIHQIRLTGNSLDIVARVKTAIQDILPKYGLPQREIELCNETKRLRPVVEIPKTSVRLPKQQMQMGRLVYLDNTNAQSQRYVSEPYQIEMIGETEEDSKSCTVVLTCAGMKRNPRLKLDPVTATWTVEFHKEHHPDLPSDAVEYCAPAPVTTMPAVTDNLPDEASSNDGGSMKSKKKEKGNKDDEDGRSKDDEDDRSEDDEDERSKDDEDERSKDDNEADEDDEESLEVGEAKEGEAKKAEEPNGENTADAESKTQNALKRENKFQKYTDTFTVPPLFDPQLKTVEFFDSYGVFSASFDRLISDTQPIEVPEPINEPVTDPKAFMSLQ